MFIPLKMLIGIDPYPIPQTFRPIPIFPPGEDTKGDSSGPDFLMDAFSCGHGTGAQHAEGADMPWLMGAYGFMMFYATGRRT